MLTKTFNDLTIFKSRRDRLNELAGEAVFILFSGEEGHLANFRAASHFVYLSGFEEPESCAVVRTGSNPSFHLFVRDKNPDIEIWDGERFGPEKAKTEFGADFVYSISDLLKCLPDIIRGCDKIYYQLGEDKEKDQLILEARYQAQQKDRRAGKTQTPIHDPNDCLAPMRVVKDKHEQEWMKHSCELSAQAHLEVMKNVKPGMNERQVLGHLLGSFYEQQAMREGYCSIIASGVNATTLHYRTNNRDMQDGDFLLIDAGAEKNYYTADITRTYPVNGKFTEAQKELYQSVLDVQKKLIQFVQPGFSLPELQDKACILLTERLVELGILSGSTAELVEEKKYQKYYPHGVGHFLGMDVHDVGFARKGEQPVPFEEGMVITVEPGLYIPVDDSEAPERFRGLGVRIEDDVLITSKEPLVMTASAPKEINDLEAIIGKN